MSKSKRATPPESPETQADTTRPKKERAAPVEPRIEDADDMQALGFDESDAFALSDQSEDTSFSVSADEAEDVDVPRQGEQPAPGPTPSWFGTGFSEDESGELADRYRAARAHAPMFEQPSPQAYEAYRQRLEERFQSAKRMANGPIAPFSTMPAEPTSSRWSGPAASRDDDGNLRFREWQKKMDARQNTRGDEEGRPRLSPLRIAGLFALACGIGGAAGLASANFALVRAGYDAVAGAASSSVAAIMASTASVKIPAQSDPQTAAGGGSTVLTKKPVRMARVDVEDASGALNNPIPLALTAIPSDPEMPLALKITGLPGDAYLTQGTEVADGEWLLKPAEIEGVKLVVPQAQSSQIDLAVAGVEEKTGVPATPPREMTVALDLGNVTVQPASAPPESQAFSATLPQAIPLPQEAEADTGSPEAKTMLGKGEALLKTGDLVSARQFFIKAHGLGMAAGAFGAGQTYDPAVYTAMNVHGLAPDPARAREWYDKAASAGHDGAIKALEKLNAATP
jgi:hypothetical protein